MSFIESLPGAKRKRAVDLMDWSMQRPLGPRDLSQESLLGSLPDPSVDPEGGIDGQRGGNTMDPPSARKKMAHSGPQRLVRWCFTLKHSDERKAAEMAEMLGGFAKEFYFQLEEGSGGTNYKHWQGCMAMKIPSTFNQVKNLLFNDVHLEQCRDWFASKQYCKKEESRIEGPYDHNTSFLDPAYQLARADFYEWQETVVNWIAAKPDDRHITWIYDECGGNGKTKFVLYCVDNLKAVRFNSGKESDIAYSYNNEKVVLFDFQRSKPFINYSTMEDLKNGHLFSAKYESCAKRFNPPHVIVFANTLPEFSKMSLDRWVVYTLNNKILTRMTSYVNEDNVCVELSVE